MAAAALSFTACTSDDNFEQSAQKAATENIGVGFDVYVPGSTTQTRAGRVNVVNNTVLQQTGFGLFAYQTDNAGYSTGIVPNYMWNQQVYYNSTASGWYYAPLKYWPNETKNDSQILPTNPAGMPNQTSPANIDKLTFFAYAPWVSVNQSTGVASSINTDIETTTAETGIFMVTNTSGALGSYYEGAKKDPLVSYKTAKDPNESVDLLWGVAPAGGLNYTNVSGNPTSISEGMPLIDLIKPAVNTNLKFMFQHALARLGVKIVLAADQVAAGGVFDYGNTKVTVEKIDINGHFGTSGHLNMNNKTSGANVANWVLKNEATGENAANPVLTIEAGKGLAPHLIFDNAKREANKQQEVTGVTTTLADAIKVSSTKGDAKYKYSTKLTTPAYSATTPYFAAEFDNNGDHYATYVHTNEFANSNDSLYFHKFVTDNVSTNNEAYTDITEVISTTYPTATVFENIYAIKKGELVTVSDEGGDHPSKATAAGRTAYRKVGDTYTPTGQEPENGDYVLKSGKKFLPVTLKATTNDYYTAYPNYFMIIPTNNVTPTPLVTEEDLRTLKVKITYYVSTKDESLKDKIIYTKNEVEKDIVLPHLKNGVAYNLKLILGMTSVKVEAEVADWTTTEGVINLPQNTAE